MKFLCGLALVFFLVASVCASEVDFEDEYVNSVMESGDEDFYENTDPECRPTTMPFTCDTTSNYPKATNVHALRPNDIEMIGAFGDSITAANGAKAITAIGVLTQCRGVSWTIGGERDIKSIFTLPNVLKKYTPKLRGFSTGAGKVDSKNSHLNCAVPGATSHGIYAQAQNLVQRFKAMPDSDNQWKLVSLFIGGNDLCQFCNDRAKFSSGNYTNNIANALDYLQENLPKALVQVILTLNVINVNTLHRATCTPLQTAFCKCALQKENAAALNALVAEYQQKTADLIASGRYDSKDDFTVVSQPFMSLMTTPLTAKGKPDFSYFSKDCFHLSQKGHAAAALELWNSMLTPVGSKPDRWNLNNKAICPTQASPYIYTNLNSVRTVKMPYGSN